MAHVFEADGSGPEIVPRLDVCSVAPAPGGLAFSDGTGALTLPGHQVATHPLAWDNHMVTFSS